MRIKFDRFLTILICSAAIFIGICIKAYPSVSYLIGVKEFNKNNYIKAEKYLKTAYNFDKNNRDYRYYYVQTLAKLTPDYSVQKRVFDIYSGALNDSAKQTAENKIYEWKRNILNNIGNNYIEQTPYNNGILRWDINSFPLKVGITDDSELQIPSYYLDEIVTAFKQWEESTNFIKFEIDNKIKNPDIIVKISPLSKDICNDKECQFAVGYTIPNINNNILKNMTITLYSTDPLGNFYTDKIFYNTILHEIGHALGIMGHSYNPDDLMYMSNENYDTLYSQHRSSFQYISSRDVNTIRLLYKLAPAITNASNIKTKNLIYPPIILGTNKQISQRKLAEAKNYIKKAPELPNGYIDLGIAYAELDKSNDAINAFKKALELSNNNNDRYICLFNLSAIHMHLGKLKKAKEYAEKAKIISDTDEINEILIQIKNGQ